MKHTLTNAQKKLSDFMSDISEQAYYAEWMLNLEYVLWDAVLNGERKYGRHFITQTYIKRLIKLSDECCCWIYFVDDSEETGIPLDLWREKYNNDVLKWPDLTQG